MGRILLTHQLIKRAYELIQKGYSQKLVCKATGVSQGTFIKWLNDAREVERYVEREGISLKELPDTIEIDGGNHLIRINNSKLLFKLLKYVETAQAEYADKLLSTINKASTGDNGDWKAALTMLERMNREYRMDSNVRVGNIQGEEFKQETTLKSVAETLKEFKEMYSDTAFGQEVTEKYSKSDPEIE